MDQCGQCGGERVRDDFVYGCGNDEQGSILSVAADVPVSLKKRSGEQRGGGIFEF